MDSIKISQARTNNLKNVSLSIPLKKLVVVVGKSGSGKSSLVYDVLYQASLGKKVDAIVSKLPKVYVIEQKIKPDHKLSLGQTNFHKLKKILSEIKKGELLIVDEPCAGMASEDRKMILKMLKGAVKAGISIIAVEHSKDIIANADYVIEFGPESGRNGGRVIFEGPIQKFKKAKTPTSIYAFSDKAGQVDYERQPNDKSKRMQKKSLSINGITANNLKDYNFTFPLGSLVCVSGRMGTGKSTLLSVVYGALFKGRDAWKLRHGFKSIKGKENVRRSYFVDQAQLSAIKTSTPATYLGILDPLKRIKGVKIEKLMDKTVDEVAETYKNIPLVKRKLGLLQEVGLGYLTLGQRSGTLSGGEAQRVRLAKILSKKLGDRCIYILDTPSRGLHLSNLPALLKVLQIIIDKNNTVLVAENREEIINNCDSVVRL